MNFHEKIKKLRQSDLVEHTDLSTKTILLYEQARRPKESKTYEILAKELGQLVTTYFMIKFKI